MRIRLAIATTLLSLVLPQAIAQDKRELDRLEEKFSRYFEKAMPGWKHERVEPVVKTENVLIQFWHSPEKSVKIAVMPYRSGTEAKAALAEFIKYERDREALGELGDEAYAWGFAHSKIVFRRGKLVMYVSTRADVGAAPDERGLSQTERLEREKNEMKKWSREFAKHAAKAIDSP